MKIARDACTPVHSLLNVLADQQSNPERLMRKAHLISKDRSILKNVPCMTRGGAFTFAGDQWEECNEISPSVGFRIEELFLPIEIPGDFRFIKYYRGQKSTNLILTEWENLLILIKDFPPILCSIKKWSTWAAPF